MTSLYSKFFLSSLRCLPRLPLTFSLQSFTFIQSAPFSSSSFSSTPALNIISDLLTKECGFSSSLVTTVMRRYPRLSKTKSDHTAREVIHILKDSGFTDNQIKRTIRGCPNILGLKVHEKLKPKIEFLRNLGLASQDVPFVISHSPRVLGMSLKNSLVPRIPHLTSLFGSKNHLCKALKRTPKLLSTDFKKELTPKVEYLKNNLGILEGSAVYVRALSVVLCINFETLVKKTSILASLGLEEEVIRLILQGNPQVLRTSTRKIKENIDFLIQTAGLTPNIVASRPLSLNFSMEKTLKPRYELYKYLRANPQCKSLPSLIVFLASTEKVLIKRFGQYSPQLKSHDHTIS